MNATKKQKESIKILMADDHFAIRDGIKQMLLREFGKAEFGDAENAKELFKQIKVKKWDILILDINMPGKDGLEILEQLRDEKIKIPVLVLSLHPEDHMATRAFKGGASGYLTKASAGKELINAVNIILSGKKYITSSVAEHFVANLENPEDKKPHETLSNREFKTALLLATGKSIAEIADELILSIPTISTYRARLLDKMGMKNNAEVANYFIRNQFV